MKLFNSLLCFLLILVLFHPSVYSDNGPAHRKKQPRPIKLGTSGGNVLDSTDDFGVTTCCSGTLGSLVKDADGKLYVLSNNHVFAKVNKAHIGDGISQPGLIDARCSQFTEQVAHLSKFVKYRFGSGGRNLVDAAIAEIISGEVNEAGKIIDIGLPGEPVEAALGMRVKKSGRTSGKTLGVVTALNVSLRVQIPVACGSSDIKLVRFVDQVVVEPVGPRLFVKGGDSGSLIVERKRHCPGSVALLFAGTDDGIAIGNRIQNVLRKLHVSMVGCGPAVPVAGTLNSRDLTVSHPRLVAAEAVQARHEEELLNIPGAIGVGLGFAKPGSQEIGLVVFVQRGVFSASSANSMPVKIEGLSVRRVVTGPFKSM
jgi:hypothetical protein